MEAELFKNVTEGLTQGDAPVRVRIDNANIAYDVERFEIVDGVVYLMVDSARVNIVPQDARDD